MRHRQGWQIIALVAILSQATLAKGADPPTLIPADQFGGKFQLLGKTGKPMGTVVTVQGVVVAGFSKGCDDGPNLVIQRVEGVATQKDDPILLTPWLRKFGEDARLPKLQYGATYELEGYETGEFVGQPHEVYARTGIPIQTSGFYLHHRFEIFKGKKIDPIVFSPAEFVGRPALIQGTARTIEGKSWIEGKGWRLLTGEGRWAAWIEGKPAEALGEIKATGVASEFRLEKGSARLTRLEDQVGHRVELRGMVQDSDDVWSFDYRGTTIYVEKLKNPSGDPADLSGNPIMICGLLEKAMLPDNWQYGESSGGKLKEQFVIRDASGKKTSTLLSTEIKYDTSQPHEGGLIPELFAPPAK